MKAKENKKKKMVPVPKSVLLSLVAARLKDRTLFPEKNRRSQKVFAASRSLGFVKILLSID